MVVTGDWKIIGRIECETASKVMAVSSLILCNSKQSTRVWCHWHLTPASVSVRDGSFQVTTSFVSRNLSDCQFIVPRKTRQGLNREWKRICVKRFRSNDEIFDWVSDSQSVFTFKRTVIIHFHGQDDRMHWQFWSLHWRHLRWWIPPPRWKLGL